MSFRIDGIVPILPTPFHADETIAWSDLDREAEFAQRAGACAVCLPAYASEFYKLSEDERLAVVERAASRLQGRLPVIAQVNYASVKLAIESAKRALDAGAAAFCTAAPRQFALADSDLIDYFSRLLDAVEAPFVLQDFNPGGASLSVASLAELHRRHPNFRYVKLEEPRLAGKIREIAEATSGGLGVLEGWGGMYTIELAKVGIAGVVPGLGLTDILHRVFRLVKAGNVPDAEPLFEGILPQIVYSLQNLELFHHAEKALLQARGVIVNTSARSACLRLSGHDRDHIAYLNSRILRLIDSPAYQQAGAR